MSQNQLLTSLVTKAVTCMLAACLVTPELQPHQTGNWHWRQWQFWRILRRHVSHNQPRHSVYCHGIPAHFFRDKCTRSSPSHDQDFRKHPSDFRSFPMVFRRLLNSAKNVQRCPDNDNDFSLFIMRLRTICVDLWVRCEKLSLMREIYAFSPEAWDSHIMHECGQVQHGLRSQVLTLRHETNTVSLSISQNYWRNWNLNVWKGLYTETA